MSDLIVRSKIDEVARRTGLELRAAKSPEQLERHLAAGTPAIAFVDLEADTFDPAAAIRRLRELGGGEEMRIIGYSGHTNVAAIQGGRAAGAGVVLARSALTVQLPALLSRVADEERARAGS
jgi:DNA-binding NarL/FixJ family response regulator